MPRTDLDDAFIGTCENCGTTGVKVRRVQSVDRMFRGINRGYFDICFKCFGPQEEVVTDHGTFWSPMETEKEKKIRIERTKEVKKK